MVKTIFSVYNTRFQSFNNPVNQNKYSEVYYERVKTTRSVLQCIISVFHSFNNLTNQKLKETHYERYGLYECK